MAISARDRRFLLRCEEVKDESHDPHRKVGVVVVGESDEVLAVGANAPPSILGLTVSDSHVAIEQDPTWKYFMLEHAERNAIFAARDRGISVIGATMYGTLFPCADCARAIVASGVSRLVVSSADTNSSRDEKWLEHYRYARTIFDLAGVIVDTVNPFDLLDSDPTTILGEA